MRRRCGKGEGNKERKKHLIDNSMGITRGKGGYGEVEEGKGRIKGG